MIFKKLLLPLLLVATIQFSVHAADVYAEYKMTGLGDKIYTSKLFSKNGDVRSEVNMNIAGKEMMTASLNLKGKPAITIVFNSMNKTYSEVKHSTEATGKAPDFTMEVVGEEKIESYNCTHLRMKSNDKSWDMWLCKNLPSINFSYDAADATNNSKIVDLLKSKNVKGLPVKVVFYKADGKTPTMTMLLTKYEAKELAASLFSVPTDYTKSTVDFDPAKMKNMSAEERKAMLLKMMEQYKKK